MKLVFYLFVAFCMGAVCADSIDNEWKIYKETYEKNYEGREDKKHMEIFKENFEFMNKHNRENDKTFEVEMNALGDLEDSYFGYADSELGLWEYSKNLFTSKIFVHQEVKLNETARIPTDVNWVKRIRVSDVKDQQLVAKCDSDYAFATIDTLEAHYFIKNSKNVELSVQEIVDCSELNYGCSGGSEIFTYNYLIDHGIGLSGDYGYNAKKSECKKDKVARSSAAVYGYAGVRNENHIKQALDQVGPLTVKVKASANGFKLYRNGIFRDPSCDRAEGSHEVVLYGYGHDNTTGLDYWLIKNSWGKNWGENGYMRLERGENSCLRENSAYFPLLEASAKENNSHLDLTPFGIGIIGMIIILILVLCCFCGICICCIKWCCGICCD